MIEINESHTFINNNVMRLDLGLITITDMINLNLP